MIGEQGVPATREIEGSVENKFQVSSVGAYDLANLTVEVAEGITGSVFPWLVDGLESVKRFVVAELVEEFLGSLEGPVDVVGSDVLVGL